MTRMLQILVAISLVSMLMVTNVAAATSQGLEWGVAEDDKFNYTLTIESENDTISDGVYFEITSLSTIPNTMDNFTDIPITSSTWYWTANDTALSFWSLFLIILPTAIVGGYNVVPIGNYDLLTTLHSDFIGAEEELENVTVTYINNYHYWGVSATWDDEDITMTLETTFLKSDGALATASMSGELEDETVSLSLTRLDLPSEIETLIMSNILYIGIGVGVVIILGAVVCKKN
ncbi:MAG: hypothetical protein GF411_16655 [Candidatus Lokiarchaeota archaeon]|nr:hypothetical protein [Candidatus Lokiarchaeota archaeon]